MGSSTQARPLSVGVESDATTIVGKPRMEAHETVDGQLFWCDECGAMLLEEPFVNTRLAGRHVVNAFDANKNGAGGAMIEYEVAEAYVSKMVHLKMNPTLLSGAYEAVNACVRRGDAADL